jgi:hypothetical protein
MNNRECVAIATALAQAFAENLEKYRGKSADPMTVLSTAEEHISHALQIIHRRFNTKAFHEVVYSTAWRMLNKKDRGHL